MRQTPQAIDVLTAVHSGSVVSQDFVSKEIGGGWSAATCRNQDEETSRVDRAGGAARGWDDAAERSKKREETSDEQAHTR